MKRYRAFGLEIETDIALDELSPSGENALVDLRIQSEAAVSSDTVASDEPTLVMHAGAAHVVFPGVAAFELRPDHNLIRVRPVSGAQSLVPLPLLGPVLALWMHLKGDLVLHASAVSWRNGVYAFVGDKGAGKSTTAAALLAAGASLATDDLLRISGLASGAPVCQPAFAQLKLTDSAAEVLAPPRAHAIDSPHPDFAKQRWRLDRAPPAAQPLKMICTLARGAELALAPLAPSDALKLCLEQVFVRRYGAAVLADGAGARQFVAVAKLVETVPVSQLTVPEGLVALQQTGGALMRRLEAATG